jgi:hypothetical protein
MLYIRKNEVNGINNALGFKLKSIRIIVMKAIEKASKAIMMLLYAKNPAIL